MDLIVIRATVSKFGLFPFLRHMHQNSSQISTALDHKPVLGAICPRFLGFAAP
jgi:hypothetical protein